MVGKVSVEWKFTGTCICWLGNFKALVETLGILFGQNSIDFGSFDSMIGFLNSLVSS
jgi:hypothetical protein